MKGIFSLSLRLFLAIISPLLTIPIFAADLDKLSKDDWVKISTANFEIITDLDADEAQYLIKDLEAFRYFTVDLMGLQVLEGIPPLKILAINSRSNFKRLDLPENWAGMFGLGLAGYAAIASVSNYKESMSKPSWSRQVLLHEYVHHLMRFTRLTRPYPKWYDEGNADYLGSFRYDGTKVYLGDFNSMQWRAWALFGKSGSLTFDSQKLMNTVNLNMTSKKSSDQEAVSVFYGQAFFLMQYINTDPVLKSALQNYLYDIYLGYPQDLAFERSFKITYKELDQRVIKYLRKGAKMSIYGTKDKDSKLKFPEFNFQSKAINQADFFAEMTDVIPKFGIFSKEIKQSLFNKAIELNPQNYELQAKSLIYGLTDTPDLAIKTLEQQIPNNSILFTYKGEQHKYHANMLRLTGAANWEMQMKEARSYYRRALKADPFNAMAYMGLGKAYLYLPETEPLREGILGFDQASIFVRDDEGFIGVADIALRMQDNSKVIIALRNGIAFGGDGTRAAYGYILDNLEILLELKGADPAKKDDGLVYEEGSYYRGALKDGKPNGVGKITRVNGSYYEGEFVNGTMHGKGKLWSTHGNVSYEGDFQEGIMRGKGVLKLPDILLYTDYTGEVEYGQPHGQGTSVAKKGTFTGQFWWGLQNGKGIFVTSGNKTRFEGRWIYGKYEWPAQHGEIYVGDINHEGWRTGQGLCRPADSYDSIVPCEYNRGNKINPTDVQ